MKIPDSLQKYRYARSRSLSLLGKSYEDDWAFTLASFTAVFIVFCIAAGVGYYWMVASVIPENLAAAPVNTAIYTSDKNMIVQTQAYLQAKQQQFDAASGDASASVAGTASATPRNF